MSVCVYMQTYMYTHTHFAARVKQFITGTVMGFSADAVRDGRSGCTTDAMRDGWSLPLVRFGFTADAKRDGWRGGAEGLGTCARLGRVRRCISIHVNT